MLSLSLDPAAPGDRDAVWDVWHACARDETTCWNDDYPTPAVLDADIAAGRLYVFRHDGQVIGSATLMPPVDIHRQGYPFAPCRQPIQLTRLCIHPGRARRGLGAALLQHAEALAAAQGADAVHLLCDVNNRAGLALFTRAGYAEVCRATLYGDSFSVREKRLAAAIRFDTGMD